MNHGFLQTERLKLVLYTPEAIRERIAAATDGERAQISPDWLSQVVRLTESDPWIHGFAVLERKTSIRVGSCGFKGPPTPEGMVELAYGIEAEHQGKGYATEAAAALVEFAFADQRVRIVRAHTLLEGNASIRVLTKCGF